MPACHGQEALEIAYRTDGLDLLVSNIQMPGITGPDLAKQLPEIHPNLHILLISAYPQGVLTLDNGWHFFKKPFHPKALIEKIKQVLRDPPQPETDSG